MNGETQLLGVMGWPVKHSKSPTMHNAAFKHLGLNYAYVALPINPIYSFKDAVLGLRAAGLRGASVTVPYKEEAFKIVDSLSEDASAIGAVNTLVFEEDGRLRGENTDAPGFMAHLKEEGFKTKGASAVVIGAGGASRAIAYALKKNGIQKLTIVNRTRSKAEDIARAFDLEALEWSSSAFEYARSCDLIVNATSLGLNSSDVMPWDPSYDFSSSQTIYDAIYAQTPLMKKAIKDGAKAISGEGMLLWQGVIAFEMWTGQKAPVDVMRQELRNA